VAFLFGHAEIKVTATDVATQKQVETRVQFLTSL
jgi:hypothetical protein